MAVALNLTGCTGWYARPELLTQPWPADDQVRLCVHSTCRQVHAVRIAGDSLTAVPYFQAADCDSCTIHLAVSEVDRVQRRGINTSATVFLGIVTLPIVAAFVYLDATAPRD